MIMYLVRAEDVHDEVDVYGRPGREEDHADPHQQQVGPPPPRLLPQERLGVGGGQRQPGHRRGDPGGAGGGIFPIPVFGRVSPLELETMVHEVFTEKATTRVAFNQEKALVRA